MVGIKGLMKGARPDIESEAERFIRGANERVAQHNSLKKGRQRTYQRYTFSLTPEVSTSIDKIALVPKEFKINRSEVIKASIELLESLSEDELINVLSKVKHSD